MSKMYVCRPINLSNVCLKIIADNGLEFSLAFDDSHLGGDLFRSDLAVYENTNAREPMYTDDSLSPEEMLHQLAIALGYTVTKKA